MLFVSLSHPLHPTSLLSPASLSQRDVTRLVQIVFNLTRHHHGDDGDDGTNKMTMLFTVKADPKREPGLKIKGGRGGGGGGGQGGGSCAASAHL